MDAEELLIKLDKIANDVLRLTYEETFKAIYETTYKNAKLTEQTKKKNIQYIAELQKEMNFYYEDLRDFDTKPRDDWNTLQENLVSTRERVVQGLVVLQKFADNTNDEVYKTNWNFIATTFKQITNATLRHVRDTLAADQKFCELYQRFGIDYIEKFKLRQGTDYSFFVRAVYFTLHSIKASKTTRYEKYFKLFWKPAKKSQIPCRRMARNKYEIFDLLLLYRFEITKSPHKPAQAI